MESSDWIAIALTGAIVLVGIGLPSYLAIKFYHWFEGKAQQHLERIGSAPEPTGDAESWVSYHTYHGFLFWATQTTHWISPTDASPAAVLDDLRAFNRKWGTFAFGFGLIPVLSFFEYRKARRRIQQLQRPIAQNPGSV